MTKELLEYFNDDELSASVWYGKYALKNGDKQVVENTPLDMHIRMAKELARAEAKYDYNQDANKFKVLSEFGQNHYFPLSEVNILQYLHRFKYIIPQGSIMSALGNHYKLQSLSNCFVVEEPLDSYGGIFKTDQEIAQLEKRRGGVGTTLNKLRYDDAPVLNAAGTSTGAHSFMSRFSNTTREVAQNGRRGALMLLMSILHPDVRKFIIKKKDRTQVTGANVSVQIVNEFMKAVEEDRDFLCRFPVDVNLSKYEDDGAFQEWWALGEYNKIWNLDENIALMKVKSREIYDLIIEMAWENAEPGVAFMDRVHDYSPEGVYAQFRAIASNPCGEQWLQANDACRLLATNLYSFVKHPFTKDAEVDYKKVYEVFYIQQRLADAIVDLEIEYVDKIIKKIENDPEPDDIKAPELNLWRNVRKTASASRRTGCGFTALGDMLAALGLKYDSDEAIAITEEVMKTKMRAELDCTIDLAILRGTFTGWDSLKEFKNVETENDNITIVGQNDFYKMLKEEFPDQVKRMRIYGRRNVSWSTVAPTGSVSIIAILNKYSNTTGGLEPCFMPFYFRNKKVNPSDKNARVDFTDQNGDAWMTYPVVMGGFKEWYLVASKCEHAPEIAEEALSRANAEDMQKLFEQSPYYGSCANDISWEKRVQIQGVIQKYTTNAISSTLNLPKDVSKETVSNIYFQAWKAGLKGVTVYRDGSRSGVLVAAPSTGDNEVVYRDAPKRPKSLDAECVITRVKGNPYAVIIGFLNGKPYEVFAHSDSPNFQNSKGKIVKSKKGVYDYVAGDESIAEIQSKALHADEQMLTRLVSGMMRHGINPTYIVQQINKCPLEIVSFGKALSRIISKYIPKENLKEKCSECGEESLVREEGCLKCTSCGHSKCS